MQYFKINGVDFSAFVNELKVARVSNYNAQTNAAGNTVVDLINQKHTIEVSIIPLDANKMRDLQQAIEGFSVNISFLNPTTGALYENMPCIIPDSGVEYFTIQAKRVLFNGCSLKFSEL